MSSGESVEENVEKKRKKKKKHRKMSRSPSPYESVDEPMPPAEEAASFEHSPVPKKVSETFLKDFITIPFKISQLQKKKDKKKKEKKRSHSQSGSRSPANNLTPEEEGFYQ